MTGVELHMDWKPLLASITESVDEELRLRNAYLAAENRILRNQLKRRRVQLTDAEREGLTSCSRRGSRPMVSSDVTKSGQEPNVGALAVIVGLTLCLLAPNVS